MKALVFCSFLIAIFNYSCKPKPLDNLKEVARQAEENKVKRVSRPQLAQETQRVADSVLHLSFMAQREMLPQDSAAACNFAGTKPYLAFQEKYNGRAVLVTGQAAVSKLQTEMAELRKYRNELTEAGGSFPTTFQTLTDSLLYVRQARAEDFVCEPPQGESFWTFRFPKPKFVEIMTVKVKPKPEKGPNW